MRKVILTKGLPASGKSTWAKETLRKNPGTCKRINKDDLRKMLDDSCWSKENERLVEAARDRLILLALEAEKDVIVDDTNLNPKHEQHIRELVHSFNLHHNFVPPVKVEIQDFTDVPLETCIIRDAPRMDSVGETVIRRMHDQFLASKITKVTQESKLPKAIICDLDGTLALLNGRNPYDQTTCDRDLLNEPIAELLREKRLNGRTIILFSGRDDSAKEMTKLWLMEHDVWHDILSLRKPGDGRADEVIKLEMFNECVRDRFFVEFVLDDRNKVVKMWRALGLTCLQVNEGDF